MADLKFLDEIIGTEQQAADLVKQASDQAKGRVDKARTQAADIIRQGRETASDVQKEMIGKAESEAEQIVSQSRLKALAKAKASSKTAEDRLDIAARLVAERIVSDHARR